MRARLIPLEGGPPIELTREMTLIGRKEDCDLQLDHKSISKLHCVLVKADGLIHLRDLGSTNGTRVNGQRVRRAMLLPNDQIHIASVPFQVKLGGEDPIPVSESPEYTAHMSSRDVAKALGGASLRDEDSDEDLHAGPPIQQNALPDFYPDAPPKK
jgi:pSer/pThr/pTyr-binding forkhead associated (FHA) protein